MTREEIEKLASDYLNDKESTLDMERLFDFAIQMTESCKDTISRREALLPYAELRDDDVISVRTIRENIECLLPVQSAQVIMCKDCNEWHRGKNHNGIDVCSDEGYCSVHRIIVGENYYCGDAERR